MKKLVMSIVGCWVLLAGAVLRAEGLDDWSKEYSAPKGTLMKVLAKHLSAAPTLADWESKNPGQLKELVDFLLEKGNRSVGDFCDNKGPDAAELRKAHKAVPDAFQGFRDWLRGEPAAAAAMAKNSDVFKTLFLEAEASSKEASSKKKKKKK